MKNNDHGLSCLQNTSIQGRAVKLNQPENKMSCTQRDKFFCLGVDQKVLGLGVLGLKYHVLGLKLVVSDQSNYS